MFQKFCLMCKGYWLKKEVFVVLIDGCYIGKIIELFVVDVFVFFKDFIFFEKDMQIVNLILCEIVECLSFLDKVGFDYLILSRVVGILFGGEVQCIRLVI